MNLHFYLDFFLILIRRYLQTIMESIFDLDVEHMYAVFVSYDGHLENMFRRVRHISQMLQFMSCTNPPLLLISV